MNRPLSIGLLLITVVSSISLISCGGGPSAAPPPPPPPPPPAGDFSLGVEVPSVTIQQGGAQQGQGIQATLLNGFTGTINLTLSGLPAGVTTAPAGPFSLSGPGLPQVAFQLAASTSAAIGSSTVTVTGTSGAITHSVTFPLMITSAAPFSIHVSPTALSLTPGTSATVQVSLTVNSGTAPQLFVSVSGPPNSAGINMTLPQSLLTPTNPVSFRVSPTVLAQPLQNFPVVITAGDSLLSPLNSSSFTLPLTVTIPFTSNTTPTRSTFVRTDKSPTGMVYDQSRKLLFVSIEILNEVLVLSSVDGHQVATIPVNFPAGIDEAADGSAVYVVSPYFGGITIIDPNLFQAVGHASVPQSVSGSPRPVAFLQVASLSNGKVVLCPALGFVDLAKPPFYLWDPKADTFSRFGPLGFLSQSILMSRSADHSKLIANEAAAGGILYDVYTDSFVGPTPLISGISAINSDGSQLASALYQNSVLVLAFYDSNFNLLSSLSYDSFSLTGTTPNLFYSLDGKRLFVVPDQGIGAGNFGAVATIIDTRTFSIVGIVPCFSFGASLPFSGQWITTLALDETNMLFGAAFGGVGFLDMSSPTSLKQPPLGSFLMQPTLASTSSPTQATLSGTGFSQDFDFNLFVGAPPASPSSLKATNISVQSTNYLKLTIPEGAAGPANATLTRSDGFFEVIPDAVTFGPTILRVDADAGSPSGNDTIKIFGYGLDSPNTQVTIAGRAATIVQANTAISEQLFPTESLILKTPPGTPGKSDVTITTPGGFTTKAGGFHYLNSVQVYPAIGALDALVYDRIRQRLYVTNEDHNRVEIFDIASSKFLSPVSVGNDPTALALTPDSKLLAVVNRADGTVSVVDPVKMQVNATHSALTSAERSNGCDGVVLDISPAAPHRMMVDLQCTSTAFGGTFHLLNLDTGSLTCTGVAGCGLNGTDISFGFGLAAMASTLDGNKIFLAGAGDRPVGLLDLIANTLNTGFTGTFSDAAASADGTVFAATFGISDAQLNRTSIMAFEPYADSGSQSLHNVHGEKLNASGSLLFFPQDSGVDIFDVHTGRLVRHVILPEPIPFDINALVLDETGSKMFLISNSGITVAQLDEVPLGLATVNPSAGPSGTTVTLRGSGFRNGATVKFGTLEASTTVVDSNTLKAIVPALAVGPVRVTVTNPDGSDYTFDDAFTIN